MIIITKRQTCEICNTYISHTHAHAHTHTHTHIPMCFYRPFVYAASSSRPLTRHTWRPNQGGCMYIERSCMAVALCSMLCSLLHALLHALLSAPCSGLCSMLHALVSAPCWSLSAVACCRLLPGCIAAVNRLPVLFGHYLSWVEPGSCVGEACHSVCSPFFSCFDCG